LSQKLPFTLSLAALLSGAVTYWALTQSAALSDKTRLVLPFIYLDIILLLLLAIVIAKRLVQLWLGRRRKSAGSKLHIHIVTLFSVVAVTPAIIVAVFSARFFDLGIEAWFGKPVKDALHEARVVSEAYLVEHQKAIKIDAHSLVNKLRPNIEVYLQNPELFSQVLSDEADERGLGELLVFNGNGQVIARSYLTFALELEKIILDDFDKVQGNEIAIRASKDRVRALTKLDPLTDVYLFVGKLIDPDVSLHINRTRSAIQDYYALSQQHSGAQLTFVVFFALIVLLLLLAAIWAGLTLADVLVA
jgi:two-component system nitrogen regulation sensor histidine kinase NtrY